MNWRGIFGIYAGFAVVLGGAWLWLSIGTIWGLAVIGLGFALAAASGAWIVLARRGPRPAKIKAAKVGKAAARKAAAISQDEADTIAKARLAAITGRTSGRTAAVEAFEQPAPEPVHASEEVSDIDPSEPEPEPEPEPQRQFVESIENEEAWPADDRSVVVADTPLVENAPLAVSVDDGQQVAPVALDALPGFPWTARFIGLWTREVRFACPDDLRGAVVHWQRWADEQDSGTPIVGEASAEFQAMLAAWREWGGEVPGLSSEDEVARKLAEEAAEDEGLAAVLPPVLLQLSRQDS